MTVWGCAMRKALPRVRYNGLSYIEEDRARLVRERIERLQAAKEASRKEVSMPAMIGLHTDDMTQEEINKRR